MGPAYPLIHLDVDTLFLALFVEEQRVLVRRVFGASGQVYLR